jgi:hypothetical protein
LNLNYVVIVKQDINKLLAVGFIKPVEEVIWLSPIMVVPKKNCEVMNLCGLKKAQCDNKEKTLHVVFYR